MNKKFNVDLIDLYVKILILFFKEKILDSIKYDKVPTYIFFLGQRPYEYHPTYYNSVSKKKFKYQIKIFNMKYLIIYFLKSN